MGTSLNGLTPAATYQGLIKFRDNSIIGASLKFLSDGSGNDLPISVATNSVGINTTTSGGLVTIKGTTSSGAIASLLVQNSGGAQLFRVDNDGWTYGIGGNFSSSMYVGGASVSSRLSVKGSGSTSATTSLLVQNSSAVTKISCNDDSTTLNLLSGVAGSSVAQVTIGSIATGTMFLEANVDGGTTGMRVHTNRQNTPIFFGCTSASTPTSDSITIGNSTNATGATHNIMFRQSNAVVGGFPNSANTTYPSAQFFIESTTRGFLPPRMTTTQKNAITTPAQGLMVFDTTLAKLCVYSGTAWETITSV